MAASTPRKQTSTSNASKRTAKSKTNLKTQTTRRKSSGGRTRKSGSSQTHNGNDDDAESDAVSGHWDVDSLDGDDTRDGDYGENLDSNSTDEGDEEEEKVYDSDALDDEEFSAGAGKRKRGQEKKVKHAKKAKTTPSPKKANGKQKARLPDEDEEDEEGDDIVLADGQEIVGRVVQAPTTGRVPPGQISQNTLNFLTKLKNPKYNDRQWFKLHEPVYRLAETEWKNFIDALTGLVSDVDAQVPPLPPKDLIHRIYRDVRFSNNKTPYKTELSANFSRTGRKGIFAGYHVAIKPDGGSFVAAGIWCPNRPELANIRTNLQRGSRRFREVLSEDEFVKFFGAAEPCEDGRRQNIFGMDDELKTAPKGVDKTHKDIALLKCRSFCVSHHFLDSEVLDPDFKDRVVDVIRVMRPFVHCLNELMVVGGGTAVSDDEDDEGDDEED